MKIIDDNAVFKPVARELAIRLIHRIASLLHDAPEVAFDVTSNEALDSDLLFNICFLGAAEFEEKSGIQMAGRKYTPRVAFDFQNSTVNRGILVGSTQVHGFVDDNELLEGITRARKSIGL